MRPSVLVLVSLFVTLFRVIRCSEVELQLLSKLFDGYEKLVRPVNETQTTLSVRLGLTLQQIIDVDEKDQIITVSAWLKYTWKDESIGWKPQDYCNTTKLIVPIGALWKPDVLLYNSVDASFDNIFQTNAGVFYNGRVVWVPPGIFQISCRFDIMYFPFDEQICFFKFGVWTYDGNQVDLVADTLDMSNYLENGEWIITNTTVVRSVLYYECCPEPYPDVKFFLTIRRRTLYYYFNLIFPCVLISGMSVLGFSVPSSAGEKITLQITVMLAIAFFLRVVNDMTPTTSEALPLLGVFFSACLFLVTMSVFLTMIVLNMHHRAVDCRKMNWLMHLLFVRVLPPLLGMSKARKRCARASVVRNMPPIPPTPELNAIEHRHRLRQLDVQYLNVHRNQPDECSLCFNEQLKKTLFYVSKEIKYITGRMAAEDAGKAAMHEWRFASAVADRLCLVLLVCLVVVSVAIIMCRAPYLFA